MPVATTEHIAPTEIRERLAKHLLVDGLPFVLDLRKSRGAFLYDAVSGREIIDLFTCFATSPLGFNHPAVDNPEFHARVLPAAVNKPSNSDFYTTEMAEFVEALAGTLPEPLAKHMFFIEGGAPAVENALKTAFDWKTRMNEKAGRAIAGDKMIHLEEAFHGRSGYTMSLTNTDPNKVKYFPQFDWPRIENPHLSFPVTEEVLAGVIAAEDRSLAQIHQALASHPHRIAGLIIEPIQGEGGDNHFRPEYLRRLRQLADEAEFLLIFDEVQTGFGTTGKWWCFEHLEVQPDILAFGKKSQVCGICATPRIDEIDSVFEVSSRINSTWGGNLADMIRCTRYIEIINQENLLRNAEVVGRHFLEGLQALADDLPHLVTNPRGRGMFLAFDLPDRAAQKQTVSRMVEEGVLGISSGTRGIRFRPPLNLPLEVADQGLRRLRRALLA